MSRWDALKPGSSSGGDTHNYRSKQDWRQQNNMKSRPRINLVPIRRKGDEAIATKKLGGSNDTSLFEEFQDLKQSCKSCPADVQKVTRLSILICTSGGKLSSEETATSVVNDILLFNLSKYLLGELLEKQAILAILDAITSLLFNNKHAPALLAASVDDITDSGNETLIANPVRGRLFEVLQQFLASDASIPKGKCPESNNEILEKICKCLIRALHVAIKLDGARHHANQSALDVNPQILLHFFQVSCNFEHNPERIKLSLQLLSAVLKRHPECSSNYATTLLMDDSSLKVERDISQCSSCRFQYGNIFLSLLHALNTLGRNSNEICDLATECTTELIGSLPLRLWLRQEKYNVRKIHSSSTFQSRVIDALEKIIRIVRCRLNRLKDDGTNLTSFCSLVEGILTKIPFLHEGLEAVARTLIQSIAEILLQDSTNETKLRKALGNVLFVSFGGQITPQGNKTAMSAPLRSWLDNSMKESSQQNGSFIENLLLTIKTQNHNASDRATYTKLVNALLREFPSCVLESEKNWSLLEHVISSGLGAGDKRSNIEIANFLESLSMGRAECDLHDTPSQKFLEFSLPIILALINGDNSSCKSCCCTVVGWLTQNDWGWIMANNGKIGVTDVLSPLIRTCEKDSSSIKLKSDACKALGHTCSHLFSNSNFTGEAWKNAEITHAFSDVTSCLEQAIHHPSSSVRSMALFAAGNFVQSLQALPYPSSRDLRVFVEVARYCVSLMMDPDEKVAGNAIRSTGHFSALLIRHEYKMELERSISFDVHIFLKEVLISYRAKIQAAIALALRSGKPQFSWKQRSGIKKHGWGACNSLSLLFNHGIARSELFDTLDGLLFDLLICLFQCSRYAPVMHEKVSLSAMSAVRALSSDEIRQIMIKGNSRHGKIELGETIHQCFTFVLDTTSDYSMSPKLCAEIDLFLDHLLPCASFTDIKYIVKSSQMSENHGLQQLYHWLVAKEAPVQVFDSFARAMQSPEVVIDIQTEHMFSNQAKISLIQTCDDNDNNDEL